MTYKKFEEMPVWCEARSLCFEVLSFTRKPDFSKDFELVRQIKRSSGSVMDNIAEGFERQGNKEFINFLYIAKGSAGETRSQLYRALDSGYIDQEEFNRAALLAGNICKSLSNFTEYLRGSKFGGYKYLKE